MKKLRLFVVVLLCVTVIALARLHMHTATEPFTLERMFSKENVLEVAAINAIAAVILAVWLWLWKR
jgi:hypothetical protein